jgi:hypothetical protein
MKRTLLATAVILTLAAAAPAALAKGKPPPRVETGNNLSFATTFVPNAIGAPALRIPSAYELTAPSGPECTQFPGYWCQKTLAMWQAEWNEAASIEVTAVWGANLLGDAPLKSGRPIRVEMVLTESGGGTGAGYVVTKLTPELDDRVATYGTAGTIQNTEYVVWDAQAQLSIERCTDASCTTTAGPAVYFGPMSAEINSIGKVVYGYNWGTAGKGTAAEPGVYKLTFSVPERTAIVSVPGAAPCPQSNCAFVIIEVTQAAGGGGGPPDRP